MTEVMMKKCDYCGGLQPHCSPPTRDQYQRAAVTVNNITFLLPEEIAKSRSRPGQTPSRATYLKGFFCSIACFLNAVYEIVPWDKQEPPEVH